MDKRWKIEMERKRGKTVYRAYRLPGPSVPDKPENRQYFGEASPDYRAVAALVDMLNAKENDYVKGTY